MSSITVFVSGVFSIFDAWKGIPDRATACTAGILTELTARAQKAIRDALRAASLAAAGVIFYRPWLGLRTLGNLIRYQYRPRNARRREFYCCLRLALAVSHISCI